MSMRTGMVRGTLGIALGAGGLAAFANWLRGRKPIEPEPSAPVPCASPPGSRTFTAVIERCTETGLYTGYVPGIPGAVAEGRTPEEFDTNMQRALELLVMDGEPVRDSEFVGAKTFVVR